MEKLLANLRQAVSEGLLHTDVKGVLAHDVSRLVGQNYAAEADLRPSLPLLRVVAAIDLDLALVVIGELLEFQVLEVRYNSFLKAIGLIDSEV